MIDERLEIIKAEVLEVLANHEGGMLGAYIADRVKTADTIQDAMRAINALAAEKKIRRDKLKRWDLADRTRFAVNTPCEKPAETQRDIPVWQREETIPVARVLSFLDERGPSTKSRIKANIRKPKEFDALIDDLIQLHEIYYTTGRKLAIRVTPATGHDEEPATTDAEEPDMNEEDNDEQEAASEEDSTLGEKAQAIFDEYANKNSPEVVYTFKGDGIDIDIRGKAEFVNPAIARVLATMTENA